MTLIAWFLDSKLGRWIIAAVAVAGAVGIALLEAFSKGKAAERRRQVEGNLNAVKDRNRIGEDVARLPDSVVDDELRKWSK